ncbi:cytochrome bc1 complex cytochrome b subunit [Streptosporangium sandarakinum]|uniref:cytochrome bc1 complex cytochrome b subunit n=1 Tax=Streptosporangium sandarakinum TaxID=1260955 RepID=UPI0036961E01
MSSGTVPKPIASTSSFLDDRLGAGNFLRRNMRKIFPDHWSFLLGEIALYTFVILLLTGTFLTFFFKPSMQEVTYTGSYEPLRGVMMSEAYASTLDISFDVRGGLLMRQMHHWAALLFIGGLMIHMLRVFFTGAYRKPRELNWLIGVALLLITLVEGLTGYSLPDDLLSGAGLRITAGIAQMIPIVGTWMTFLIFGGEFPGSDIIARFYSLHILLIPALLLALITGHLILMWVQKHTQMPGKGRTNMNVVGSPLWPAFMIKSGAYFMFTFATVALLGGLAQINPIWLFGPYNPANISAGTQPDFYMGFLDGALRLMPGWEIDFAGYTLTLSVLIPALGPILLITLGLALYPFMEQWVTGDRSEHHVADRPRNNPHRTSIGMAAVTFYGILWLSAANDVIAAHFHLSMNALIYVARVLIFLGPFLAYVITYRICLGLQRRDAQVLAHGVEAGVIKRLPDGEYIEVHAPPTPDLEDRIRGKAPVPMLPGLGDGHGNGHGDGDGEVPPEELRGRLGRLRAMMSRAYGGEKVPLEESPEEYREHEEEEHAVMATRPAGGRKGGTGGSGGPH